MNDLDWLTERRPDVAAPDDDTTAYARTALLAYALRSDDAAPAELPSRERVAAGGGASRRDDRRPPRRGSRPPRRAPLYALAVAVFAIAIVVGASALPSGDGPARKLGAPAVAEAALVTLSQRLASEPAPTGDATLVLRSHDFPDAKDFTGADLYLDDGRYYYGITVAELKAQSKYGDIGEGVPKQERAAAIAAIDLAPDSARRAMIDATFAGGHEPTAAEKAESLKHDFGRAEKERLLEKEGVKLPPPASQLTIDNNRVWMGGMDTLISGAGDPKVRAGVMKLLSTIEKVKVTRHADTLEITNTDFSDGYQETMIIDWQTGVIKKMIGGDTGKPASVTVDYDIKRVEARDFIG